MLPLQHVAFFFSEAPDWIPSSVPTDTLRVQGDCIAVL